MTPDEFEKSVALYYKNLGYNIKLTAKSNDYGVDIVAENDDDRIAIQVKMYDNREINYKEVMYLYAGAKHYDCNHSILITSGAISQKAKDEAQKFNIDIIEYWSPSENLIKPESENVAKLGEFKDKKGDEGINFSTTWNKYIFPLRGKTIYTITGKKNKITNVNWSGVERISSNEKYSIINIAIFKQCFHMLIEDGSITRDEINHLYPGRASAIIFAILSNIPFLL